MVILIKLTFFDPSYKKGLPSLARDSVLASKFKKIKGPVKAFNSNVIILFLRGVFHIGAAQHFEGW